MAPRADITPAQAIQPLVPGRRLVAQMALPWVAGYPGSEMTSQVRPLGDRSSDDLTGDDLASSVGLATISIAVLALPSGSCFSQEAACSSAPAPSFWR